MSMSRMRTGTIKNKYFCFIKATVLCRPGLAGLHGGTDTNPSEKIRKMHGKSSFWFNYIIIWKNRQMESKKIKKIHKKTHIELMFAKLWTF